MTLRKIYNSPQHVRKTTTKTTNNVEKHNPSWAMKSPRKHTQTELGKKLQSPGLWVSVSNNAEPKIVP